MRAALIKKYRKFHTKKEESSINSRASYQQLESDKHPERGQFRYNFGTDQGRSRSMFCSQKRDTPESLIEWIQNNVEKRFRSESKRMSAEEALILKDNLTKEYGKYFKPKFSLHGIELNKNGIKLEIVEWKNGGVNSNGFGRTFNEYFTVPFVINNSFERFKEEFENKMNKW